MVRQRTFVAVATLAIALGPALGLALGSAEAATVERWAPLGRPSAKAGAMERLTVDRYGRLLLARQAKLLWGPEQGVVWDVTTTPSGLEVAALSGPGRLIAYRDGRPRTWFNGTDQTLVTAVAAIDEAVYFAVSPAGEVRRASADGQSSIVVRTGSSWIWDMAVDRDGRLWIATGTPGKILRYDPAEPDVQAETIYRTDADAFRSVEQHPDGGVVAGTAERGRVYRFSGTDNDVIFDAIEDEIVSVVVDGSGTVYAAAATLLPAPKAEKRSDSGNRIVVRASGGDGNGKKAGGTSGNKKPAALRPGGRLYRIEPSGAVRSIWATGAGSPYGLVVDGETLWLAVGREGALIHVDGDGNLLERQAFASEAASALARHADGRLVVGGTGDARLVRYGSRPAEDGVLTSQPIDAGAPARWGRVHWDADLPRGTSVKVEVRRGNTAEPDDSWSDWSPAVEGKGASRATRWGQLRVTLAGARGSSPLLRDLEWAYSPLNRAPSVSNVSIGEAGIAWERNERSSQNDKAPIAADDPVVTDRAERNLGTGKRGTVNKEYEPGARTFHWAARDPDGDSLRFALELQRDGDDRWQSIVRELDDLFFSWDSRTVPDGRYRVRLVADDRVDNAIGDGQSREVVSAPFDVDNTPPALGKIELSALPEGGRILRFAVNDPGGRLDAVELSLDGKPFRRLRPLDGVMDSAREDFEVRLDATETWSLRATDRAGNTAGTMERLRSETGR